MLKTDNAYHLLVHLRGKTQKIKLDKPLPGILIPVLNEMAEKAGARLSYSTNTVIHFNYPRRA